MHHRTLLRAITGLWEMKSHYMEVENLEAAAGTILEVTLWMDW